MQVDAGLAVNADDPRVEAVPFRDLPGVSRLQCRTEQVVFAQEREQCDRGQVGVAAVGRQIGIRLIWRERVLANCYPVVVASKHSAAVIVHGHKLGTAPARWPRVGAEPVRRGQSVQVAGEGFILGVSRLVVGWPGCGGWSCCGLPVVMTSAAGPAGAAAAGPLC